MSQRQQNQPSKQHHTTTILKNKKNKSELVHSTNNVGNVADLTSPLAGSSKNCDMDSSKKPLHTSMESLNMKTSPSSGTGSKTASSIIKPNASRYAAGSNWTARKNSLTASNEGTNTTLPPLWDVTTAAANSTKQLGSGDDSTPAVTTSTAPTSKSGRLRQKRKAAIRNKYVAMDCEMVGVGFNGQYDMLARVSIVNKQGDVLLDKFVKPREEVIDYRTSVSGIRPHDIENGENFDNVQNEVIKLLQGKILVGHAICHDLAVLHIKHPYVNIRDTSRYKPLCHLVSHGRTPSLKKLSLVILGLEIQTGEHNSVEDARATMSVYNQLSADWEKYLQKQKRDK